MARYMMTWEVVESRMADDPKSIAGSWKMMVEMVKKDMATGVLKDWGAFPGQRTGYSVMEGTEMDVMKFTMQYAPYVKFTTHPVAGVNMVGEFLDMMVK